MNGSVLNFIYFTTITQIQIQITNQDTTTKSTVMPKSKHCRLFCIV